MTIQEKIARLSQDMEMGIVAVDAESLWPNGTYCPASPGVVKMTAIEAMIYCLSYVHDRASDGEFFSQTAFDKNGQPHWFAWAETSRDLASPQPQSESPYPFCARLEPYSEAR